MKLEEQLLENSELEEDEDDEDCDDLTLEDQIEALIDLAYRNIPEKKRETEGEKGVRLSKEEKVNAKFFRLESLIQRRPFLMSNTVLRQNPNNVYEWLNRIQLCKDDPYLAIKTYTEAVTTIDVE